MTRPADVADASTALRGVLMAVRVKGRAEVPIIAEAVGAAATEVRTLLDQAAVRDEVRCLDDQRRWALTDQGRVRLVALNAYAGLDLAQLGATYDQFLTHDAALKGAIAAWQEERSPVRLGAVRAAAAAASPVIRQLAEIDRRYAVYARRFDQTCARVGAGDVRAVARPGADSVHQVWFELHEDLLVMLERTRCA